MNALFSKALLSVACLMTGAEVLYGSQVHWLSRPFSSHQTSDGQELDESYVFELGAFRVGFVPTSENVDEWTQNWTVLDRSQYVVENQIFGGTYLVESNEGPLATTNRGYIWGYSVSLPNEWVLISDSEWLWPEAGDPLAFPENWTVSTADDVVIGQVDPFEVSFFLQMARVSDSAEKPLQSGLEWLADQFTPEQLADPLISGWSADPEGDGIDNLTEFGLGTNPLEIESGLLEQLVEVVEQGDEQFLRMTVNKNPKAAVVYEVGITTDFSEWVSGSAFTVTLLDTADQLVVRDRTPIQGLDSRFMRLRVILLE